MINGPATLSGLYNGPSVAYQTVCERTKMAGVASANHGNAMLVQDITIHLTRPFSIRGVP